MHDGHVDTADMILKTANALADRAAQTASAYFRSGLQIDFKGDESPVTIADKKIESEVRETLTRSYPDHAILGEEYGAGDLSNEHVWVIDPIDGTRSFISGHPLYGFLLAHMQSGDCVLGMISMPELGERFVGQKGRGARLNDKPITTSKTTDLADAVVYINEGDKLLAIEPGVIGALLKVGHTRRFGYDCYPHALLAAGQVDAVVDFDLKPFDFLPIVGVIESAGGIITDWAGNPLGYASDGRVVSAATPELHAQLVTLLTRNQVTE